MGQPSDWIEPLEAVRTLSPPPHCAGRVLVGGMVVGVVVGGIVLVAGVGEVCTLGRLVPGGKAVGANPAHEQQ